MNDINILLSVSEIDFHVLAVSETWLNDDSAELLSLPTYKFLYRNRLFKQGGGLGFFIKDNLTFIIRDDLCPVSSGFECFVIEIIRRKQHNILIFAIYRPPNLNPMDFIDSLTCSLIAAQKLAKNKHIYVVGDFNINLLAGDVQNIGSNFYNSLMSINFFPLINKPTRITEFSATLIDNIFTNYIQKHFSGIIYSDISDHLPIFCACHDTFSVANHFNGNINNNFSQKNLHALNIALSQIEWSSVIETSDVNEAFGNFVDIFKSTIEQYCPPVHPKLKRLKYPWITPGLIKSLKTKNKLYRKFLKNPSEDNRIKYTKHKNYFTFLKREAEKRYIANQFNENKKDLKKNLEIN